MTLVFQGAAWGFPKSRGTSLGVPINMREYLGVHIGVPLFMETMVSGHNYDLFDFVGSIVIQPVT